jgi:hypothetical protein
MKITLYSTLWSVFSALQQHPVTLMYVYWKTLHRIVLLSSDISVIDTHFIHFFFRKKETVIRSWGHRDWAWERWKLCTILCCILSYQDRQPWEMKSWIPGTEAWWPRGDWNSAAFFILVSEGCCRYSVSSDYVPIIYTEACPAPRNGVAVHTLGLHQAIQWHLLEIRLCF